MGLVDLGVATLVIERSAYDDIRIGEHLHPSAALAVRAIASKANLSLATHFASAGIEAYWGSKTANHMDYFTQPGQKGLNLSRPIFDTDLARACELSGATVLRSTTLARALRKKTNWDVTIESGGHTKNCGVSFIVDATGRTAKFSRGQGAKVHGQDRQIAVVAFMSRSTNDFNNTRSLVETAEMGWWYSAPLGPTRSICMLITDDDLLPRGLSSKLYDWWLDQLRRTVQLAQHFPDCRPCQRLVVRSARSQLLSPLCGLGWHAVGDAAMAFDPLASQGISKALDHGKRAASSIAAYLSGDALSLVRLALQLNQEYAAYRAMRADYYRIEMRWPQSVFWKRRHEEP